MTGNTQTHIPGADAETRASVEDGAGFFVHAAGPIVAVVLLPFVLLFGAPVAAWAIGAGAVVLNRIAHFIVVRSVRDASITVALGAIGFSMFFRVLLTALTLFLIGAKVGASGDQTIGLGRPDLAVPAIIVFLLGYSVDAGIEAIRRAAQRSQLANESSAATGDTPA